MNVQSFIHLNHPTGQEVCQYRDDWWLKASDEKPLGKELPFSCAGDGMVSTLSRRIEKYLNYIITKPRMHFYLKAKQ